MPKKTREEHLLYCKQYYQNNKDRILAQRRIYQQTHSSEIKARIKTPKRKSYEHNYYRNNKEQICTRNSERRLLIKQEVLTHYGNNKCSCVKCGFSDIRALTIDHIDGNGNHHRQNSDIRGDHIYQWLRKNNLPEGYQTLCMNCQIIKRFENKEYYIKTRSK